MANEVEKEEAEESQGRKMDPELRQLGAIIRILEDMESGAKARAVKYLLSRYAGE